MDDDIEADEGMIKLMKMLRKEMVMKMMRRKMIQQRKSMIDCEDEEEGEFG